MGQLDSTCAAPHRGNLRREPLDLESLVAVLLDQSPRLRRVNVFFSQPPSTVALTPGCQIGYADHTGCRQLNRVLTESNVMKRGIPTAA